MPKVVTELASPYHASLPSLKQLYLLALLRIDHTADSPLTKAGEILLRFLRRMRAPATAGDISA